MITLSLYPSQWQPAAEFYPARLQTVKSFSKPLIPHSLFRRKQITVKARSSGETTGDGGSKGSRFIDEDGVVQDMDGYLNYLSLEYDSVWDTKPSWCQPWTITSTGVLLIAASWLLLHSAIVTSVVAASICAWWYIFLYFYPQAYADMIAERRRNVTSGVEDTYGSSKRQ